MSNEIAKRSKDFVAMSMATGQRVKDEDKEELDAEGKPINPHIPQFISKAPWYVSDGSKPSLKHQRLADDDKEGKVKEQWYRRGERAGPAATKYRKGACENCGAKTHKAKECLERPRKKGAKWTGKDIQADEVIQSFEMTWDSKRDRANGYDFDHHTKQIEDKFARVAALAETLNTGDEVSNKVVDELNPKRISDETKSSANTHLRIREDTANYLRNDVSSDSYDPKTRTIKDDPDKDDFVRATGEREEFEAVQAFAWEAEKSGTLVHAQAAPSQAALLHKQKKSEKTAQADALMAKYGRQDVLPTTLLEDD